MGHKRVARILGLAAMACALLGSVKAASANIVIDTVPVGDAGNSADTAGHSNNPAGQGAVGYDYRIGKYEVTAGQYTAFLNAVAGVDTHFLYNTNMAPAYGSGITRSGSGTSGNPYTYVVDTNCANRPVNCVSFWDACRFTNWLNNGQGHGDTETGAYTLTTDAITNNTVVRNASATWAVTSEDEWYKAAYYKGGGTNAGYWLYPTRSNTAPGQDMADALGNNANYYTSPYTYPIDGTHYTTVVGEFQNSASPCGTFDQAGDVWELNEAIIYYNYGRYRGLRGGSFEFGYYADSLQSGYRLYGTPSYEGYIIGFRVSQVPEPTSLALLGAGVMGMLLRRRGVAK